MDRATTDGPIPQEADCWHGHAQLQSTRQPDVHLGVERVLPARRPRRRPEPIDLVADFDMDAAARRDLRVIDDKGLLRVRPCGGTRDGEHYQPLRHARGTSTPCVVSE